MPEIPESLRPAEEASLDLGAPPADEQGIQIDEQGRPYVIVPELDNLRVTSDNFNDLSPEQQGAAYVAAFGQDLEQPPAPQQWELRALSSALSSENRTAPPEAPGPRGMGARY